MDRDDALRGGFEATSRPAGRITPDDVQRKEFGTARVRVGYLMHEVDEFLDEITDTLSSLLEENERLRAQVKGGARPAAAAPEPSAARPADRAAVEAFLQREKAFLQSLGSLVQGHAEELRGMVRSAREAPTPPAVDRTAVTETAGEPPAAAVADAPRAATAPTAAEATEIGAGETSTDEAPVGVAPAREEDDDVAAILGTDEADTRALDVVEAEEPIVVDEPEPTGTRRRDDPAEGSLRELFWGEE